MRLTRPGHLLLVALVAGAVTWVGSSLLDPDGVALRLTWWIPAALLAVAAAVVAAGWPVRRLTSAVRREHGRRGAPGLGRGLDPVPAPAGAGRLSDRHRVDPQRAVQALALARAAAVAGAVLAGGYAAIALLTLPTAVVEPRVERLAVAGVATAASAVLGVVGVVVERWCRLPGEGPGDRRS